MEQYTENKLQKILEKVRKEHRFLEEEKEITQKETLRRLLAKVKSSASSQKQNRLILELTAKELALLPQAILQTEDAFLLDLLLRILSLRYDWYLYEAFWLKVQEHFSNEKLLNAFQKLCLCINQDDNLYEERPFFITEDLCTLFPATPLSSEEFFFVIFSKFEKLNARSFLQKKENLHIKENSLLFEFLLTRYLIACENEDFYALRDYFSYALPRQNASYQNLILNRIFSKENFTPEQQNDLTLVYANIFPCFLNKHPLWSKLDKSYFQKIKDFSLEIFLKETCTFLNKNNEPFFAQEKFTFFQKILPLIKDVMQVNDAFLLQGQSFLLVHKIHEPFHLDFYTKKAIEYFFSRDYALQDLLEPPFVLENLPHTMDPQSKAKFSFCRISVKEKMHANAKDFLVFHENLQKNQLS